MRGFVAAVVLLAGCVLASANDRTRASAEESPFHDFVATYIAQRDVSADDALGNHVSIVDQGHDALLLRVHLMRAARRTIEIQTYIWADDECARVFRYELFKAAQRGVKVRVIADHIASNKDPAQLALSTTANSNVEIKVYRPAAGRVKASMPLTVLDLLRSSGSNQRMHIKTFIVDGIFGITGGRNIDNNYYNYSLGYNFKDRDVLVVGPSVAAMSRSFNEFWDAEEVVSSRDLKDVAREIERGVSRPLPRGEDIFFHDFFRTLDREADTTETIRSKFVDALAPAARVAYIADAPGMKKESFYFGRGDNGRVTTALMGLFQDAHESVIIQSPYAIVNRRASRFFQKLCTQKPELRIMLSTNSYGAADHLITYAANYRLRSQVVLGHGMEVFEYKPHPEDLLHYVPNFPGLEARARDEGRAQRPYLSIHAKSFVFDDHTAFIGTFNFDPRSFYLNSEDGFIIQDKAFATLLREKLMRDIDPANSWVIARKRRVFSAMNRGVEAVSTRSPMDFWPYRSTSAFELLPDREPVSAEAPGFHDNYRDIGSFPGSEGPSPARATVRIFKVFGKPATPLL